METQIHAQCELRFPLVLFANNFFAFKDGKYQYIHI